MDIFFYMGFEGLGRECHDIHCSQNAAVSAITSLSIFIYSAYQYRREIGSSHYVHVTGKL